MRVITRKRLRAFTEQFPDARLPLEQWYQTVRAAKWQNLQDVRRVYPHADAVMVESKNTVTIFNIGGNKYRLIAALHYNRQIAYVLAVLTHAEYSKGHWKKRL